MRGRQGLAVAAYGFGYLAPQPELTLHEHGCVARHPQPWSADGAKAGAATNSGANANSLWSVRR